MKTAGIIAEYNPFHAGHKYQIHYLKEELNTDFVICAMSGDYVQRGTPAILHKHIRAKMALEAGADLVLEIPAALSTASAESFAMGGVSLLDGIGITDLLCFGSESGSLTPFMEISRILSDEPDEFRESLLGELKNGRSFPAARQMALLKYLEKSGSSIQETDLAHFLSSPNNILGLEYCKALCRLQSPITPVTILRKGAGYHEKAISETSFPSASGIRDAIRSGSLPSNMYPALSAALSEGSFLLEEDFDLLLHYRLLSETAESLCQYADVSGDLARRIINCRNRYTGFLSFAQLLKTKEMTLTRIQRALLHILLSIRTVPERTPYARVLGFRRDSSLLLHEMKRRSRLPLITKAADASSLLDDSSLALFEETACASNIYESVRCHKSDQHFLHEYEKPVIVL